MQRKKHIITAEKKNNIMGLLEIQKCKSITWFSSMSDEKQVFINYL